MLTPTDEFFFNFLRTHFLKTKKRKFGERGTLNIWMRRKKWSIFVNNFLFYFTLELFKTESFE